MPPRPNGPRLSMKESMKQLDKKTLFRLLSYMKPYRLGSRAMATTTTLAKKHLLSVRMSVLNIFQIFRICPPSAARELSTPHIT